MSMTPASSQYFQNVAGEWDNLRSGYFGEWVREAAISKAYLRPEMVVADVGAGTGFMAQGLAGLVRRVYVVDGSAAMLDVARENLKAFENVEFHEADGLNLPFPEESLDAVFANMYLHHASDPLAAIREMVRVLRPGGRLVITDMDSHPYSWLKEEMADVWQGFEREQVREWFRQVDLVNLVVDCTGQSCCAESANPCLADKTEKSAQISVFVATGTRRMKMREAVESIYGALAREGGSCCSSGDSSECETCACSGEVEAEVEQCACGKQENGEGGAACAFETGESECGCGGNCSSVEFSLEQAIAPTGYSDEDLAAVPEEAAEISLGCGNPLAMASLKPGEVVVDIGSGGGIDAFLAAARVGDTGRVIGVDMTPDMLARARSSAEKRGINNVEFRQGFAENLPVDSNSVDIVISNCVINLTEDKGKAFSEAARVLKPGGRLEVSDVVLSGAMPFDLIQDMQGWSECVTGALPEKEYLDLVAQAGLKDIVIRRSKTAGNLAGVKVYSAVVSARKPGAA